ncbi:hypothetical protein PQ465_11690 [Sphingobacterium oryzagri]|uniref:Cytochrome B n=1 Tax=Sphingobacterium oryzagri TaxID=3025669 RepID=A0ABY7WED1_9SPHI|nr:hypothetical protein [Sphingobacterium sp. KACC 22765]WDF66969.1 hypothetical protein PQ465_11690 [Sphingobacterium sp. KACC 22765]
MHSSLILLHSFVRWIVLILIVYAIYRSFIGYTKGSKFTKSDNSLRHWTATTAHIQLMVGMVLYTQSAIAKAYWSPSDHMLGDFEITFFGLIHIGLMFMSIVILTIGSAMAKRKPSDREKFKTMLIWFSIALIIIFVAIPWPFSPLAQRPYLRAF